MFSYGRTKRGTRCKKSMASGFLVKLINTTIAIPAGGAGGAIAPPSFEDLGKIKIFRAAI